MNERMIGHDAWVSGYGVKGKRENSEPLLIAVSLCAGQPFWGVLMDTCGVGYVALGEADPVGNMIVVDSPGQEELTQLDVKASSETSSVEASIEMSLPTALPGFEDSSNKRRLPPEQESLTRLEQQGMCFALALLELMGSYKLGYRVLYPKEP